MKPDVLHDKLISAVRRKLPPGANLAATLSEILSTGKEAVYRRLRREVPFTFFEIALIAERMKISLDEIVGGSVTGNTLFHYNNTKFFEPREYDYWHYENSVNFFNSMENDPYVEMGVASNSMAPEILSPYDNLCRFRMFKWAYSHMPQDHPLPFRQIEVPERMRELEKEYARALHRAVKKTLYIWDGTAFQHFVNDVRYFNRVNLVTDDEMKAIKEDAYKLLDDLETMAATGLNPEGNRVEIFIASTNFETTYTYVQSTGRDTCLINVFTLDYIWTSDEKMFAHQKKWILSLRRLSILISESGEMHRVQFFRRQRELIDAL